MPITKPDEAHAQFAEAFNAGDVGRLVDLYEPHAHLVSKPDQVISGRDAIRRALQEFIALRGKIFMDTYYAFEAGDLALLRSHWRMVGSGPDGKLLELQGDGVEILRKQTDGTWLFAVDHPFGGQ
jgi:uncharacterized protein (TIGR02246 family)